eukprot:31378-Pelagococcus_subviridis.AAC.5
MRRDAGRGAREEDERGAARTRETPRRASRPGVRETHPRAVKWRRPPLPWTTSLNLTRCWMS